MEFLDIGIASCPQCATERRLYRPMLRGAKPLCLPCVEAWSAKRQNRPTSIKRRRQQREWARRRYGYSAQQKTPIDVIQAVTEALSEGTKQTTIARLLCISQQQVSRIKRNEVSASRRRSGR